MRKWAFFGFALIFLTACSKIVDKPKNLIEEKKMVALLSDIYLHQQASYLTEISNEESDFAKIDAQILHDHQTNFTDFKESFRYYYLQPDRYNEILLAVRDNLESLLPDEERKKRILDRNDKDKK